MKISIQKTENETCYVARIKGLHERYRFDREFLDGRSGRTRRHYTLTDGLFEICDGSERSCLAIVNNRRTPIDRDDLLAVRDYCLESYHSLAEVFEQWANTPGRSSDSFVALARTLADGQRAIRRKSAKRRREERRKRVRAMTAAEAFEGDNAADTRGFLKKLEESGNDGIVAAQLFRAQKASTRAKQYRGDSVDHAYTRKGDTLQRLCSLLGADSCGLSWGWGRDPKQEFAPHVLYVDLPTGQVSFHSPDQYDGPEYPGKWDGHHASQDRIIEFCDLVLSD